MRFPGHAALSATALAGTLLLGACGGADEKNEARESGDAKKAGHSQHDGHGESGAKAPKTATGTLEELSKKIKCTPNVQIDAEELRQGICGKGKDSHVLVTFKTDKNQRDWLDEAKPYGGTYLVGEKWVAVGTPEKLAPVRAELGGKIEKGTDHSGHSGGGAGGDSGGSDGKKHEDGEHKDGEHKGHSGS